MNDVPRKFLVSDPIEMPLTLEVNGRYVNEVATRRILRRYKPFTMKRGCYIFYMKFDDKVLPTYVGCTYRQTLKKESFTSNKRLKLNKSLTKYVGGVPVVQFIAPEDYDNMETDKRMVLEMENLLIQYAHAVNPRLENKVGVDSPYKEKLTHWYIDGVLLSDNVTENGVFLKKALAIP